MKKIYPILLALLLSLAVSAQDTLTINPLVKYQTIMGWGGTGGQNTQIENTPGYLITQIINESVDDLGLTGLRYECYQGSYSQTYGMCRTWEWTNDNESPDTNVWSAFDTTAVDNYMQNLFMPWKQRVATDGMPFTFYVDPSWYTQGSTGDMPAFLRYSPGEYAEYFITNLKYLKRKYGLVANYTTLFNEPGNQNICTPGLEDTMIKTVGARLLQAGLSTTIQLGEGVSAQTTWNYVTAMANDTAIWSKVKCISYHLYGTNDPYRAKIDSFANLKGIVTAQTEYVGLGIDLLYQDLTLGGVSYWDFYGNGDYMPLNANSTWFTFGAKFWTTHQVIHYNTPGSIRIGVTNNDTAQLKPLVFSKGGNITTTIINDKVSSVTTNVTVKGLPPGVYGVSQTLTSGAFSQIGLVTVPVSGIVTVPVAQNGVVTIYPHPNTLPPVATSWAANPTYIESPATSVALSATALDPQLLAIKYHWSIDSFPIGASVVLSNRNISNPTATGMTVAGHYVFAVEISNGSDSVKKTVTVQAFSGNQAPQIIEYQSRIPTIVTLPIDTTVLQTWCQDLEGDALTMQYAIVSEPVGASAIIVTPNPVANPNRTTVKNMTVPGNYIISYSVNDGHHPNVTRNILLTVYPVNHHPVIDSIGASPAIVNLPSDTTYLSSITSDPDTDIVSHWWTVKSAPVGAYPIFDAQGERCSGVSNLTVPGTYVFTLTAVDRTLYQRKDVTVVVNAFNGVNSIANNNREMELYPNPANTQLTVTTSLPIDNIQLVNVLGQTVMNSSYSNDKSTNHILNVSALQAGIYFVEVRSNNTTLTQKFLVLR